MRTENRPRGDAWRGQPAASPGVEGASGGPGPAGTSAAGCSRGTAEQGGGGCSAVAEATPPTAWPEAPHRGDMQDGRTHRSRDLAGPWWSEAPRGARGRPSCKVLPAPGTHGSSFSASSVPRWVTRGGGAPPGPSPRVPGRPDPHSPPRQGHLWWRVLLPTSLGSGKRTLYRARFPGLFPARGGLHLRRVRARIPPGWPGSGSAGIGKSPRALAPQRGRWEAGQRGEPRAPHGALGPGPAPSPLRRGFVGFVIQGRPLFVCRRCRPRFLFTAFDTHWPFCGGAKVGPVVLTRRVSSAACSTCARTAIRSRNRNHRPFRKFNDT